MKVVFEDENQTQLGYEEYSNITNVLVPSFKHNSHEMFLVRNFDLKPKSKPKSWQIIALNVDGNTATYTLKQAIRVHSLAEFTSLGYKNPKQFLRQFHIIEVDFGFHSDLFDCSLGSVSKNNVQPETLLPGEIHKKRPCIVLNVNDTTVQVIPLTTQMPKYNDPNIFQIQTESFRKMSARYTAKTSYALLNMVQTISMSRIFPPQGNDNKYIFNNQYALISQDKDALKIALAQYYNNDLAVKIKLLDNNVTKLQQERNKILSTNSALKESLEQMDRENNELNEMINSLAVHLNLGNSFEEIRETIKGLD